ncbi:hypothetical protein N2152v2_004604 [Parachlorella kessleri]
MPVGGKLVLKGGLQVTAHGVEKKKKKKKKAAPLEDLPEEERKQLEEQKKAQTGISEFDLEMAKAKEGKVKNTPWGSSFRAPPEILHGYAKKVKGKTAEERLDLRCAVKTDKFCK